jgi:probable rRNA maturation factor
MMAAGRAPRLALVVQYALSERTLPRRTTLRRWAAAALERDLAVTLRFVGATEGRALNRRYRGRDTATNVLAFVYDAIEGGDIVLCVPVIRREAREQEKAFDVHCAHLVVHGMLHLQGYDHPGGAEAKRMETRETAILAGLSIDDPYRPRP